MWMSIDYNDSSGISGSGVRFRMVKWLFLCRIPVLSRCIIWVYAKVTGADYYGHSLQDFDSLLAFFLRTRDLRAKLRGQDLVEGYVSPVEGQITFWDKLSHNDTMPIKGAGFTVSRLLGFDAPNLQTGIVFYLAPGNYHHVHAPIDMEVEQFFELPGKLEQHNPERIKNNPMLYAENKRQVIVAKSTRGERLVLVLVGAKNVGSISCPKLAGWKEGDVVSFKKGEPVGFFSLGSTVVLLLDHAVPQQDRKIIDVIDPLFGEGEERS